MGEIDDVLSGARRWCVVTGTAIEVLRTMPDACVDAMVTDPPAGIAFMNAAWDRDMGGRNAWIATIAATMREALRVCKPGAHALVWSLPRTSHWTATALEDAGWEVRDRIAHFFASGFPKSHNVSKAIDRLNGDERPDAGANPRAAQQTPNGADGWGLDTGVSRLTAPGSPESAKWEGWGTALKPAVEDWWLVRKPLEGTIAANVLAHGTGALNIDACRIGTCDGQPYTQEEWTQKGMARRTGTTFGTHKPSNSPVPAGRWPAHLALSHSPDCVFIGKRTERREKTIKTHAVASNGIYGDGLNAAPTVIGEFDSTSDAFACVPDCPVRMLDEQSGERPGKSSGTSGTSDGYGGGWRHPVDAGPTTRADSGGASRFFFVAKPSAAERAFGLEEAELVAAHVITGRVEGSAGARHGRAGVTSARRNAHPTVKSLQLMRWLVRLVTPPGGIVIDPFCGSGSTIVAARREGMHVIGIDQSATYAAFARARAARWEQVRPALDEGEATTIAKQEAADPRQGRLW